MKTENNRKFGKIKNLKKWKNENLKKKFFFFKSLRKNWKFEKIKNLKKSSLKFEVQNLKILNIQKEN